MSVFTPRDDQAHVISLHKANSREINDMNKKISKVTMTDNPEWSDAEFARARLAGIW